MFCARALSTSPSLYNSLTKSVEPLPPSIDPDTGQRRPLTWYSCGPTVYDDTHLGHARSYVSTDVVRRVMENFFGYHVHYVMGMTDVDDKIVNRSLELGVTASFLARKHEIEFFEDLERLNCCPPNDITRVTEHMSDIVEYIATIMKNNSAYELDDGVYFDVGSLGTQYGAQLGSPDSRRENGGHVEEEEEEEEERSVSGRSGKKRDRRDFALWKKTMVEEGESASEEESGQQAVVAWDSPWGRGRPGWHIECSAMTNTVLGTSFDVHSGGIDLCFPHHCNEIAQANAFNQTDSWVSTFLHTGHLHIDGLKMSKSLKNFITVRQMFAAAVPTEKKEEEEEEEKEVSALRESLGGVDISVAFRMFVLSHHYRSNITYSLDRMRDASADVRRFTSFLEAMESYAMKERKEMMKEEMKGDEEDGIALLARRKRHHDFFTELRNLTDQRIHDALSHDMNTPGVLVALRHMCTQIRGYMSDSENDKVPSELVLTACGTVLTTMERMGLDLRAGGGSSGVTISAGVSGGGSGGTGGSVDAEMDVARAFAKFRAAVRDAARRKSNPGELFQLCDEVRDVIGPSIGWEFIDTSGDVEIRRR